MRDGEKEWKNVGKHYIKKTDIEREVDYVLEIRKRGEIDVERKRERRKEERKDCVNMGVRIGGVKEEIGIE